MIRRVSLRLLKSRDIKNVIVIPLAHMRIKKTGGNNKITVTPPPPSLDDDVWQEVKVPEGVYYWNTKTDETTAIGAPKPTGAATVYSQQQQQPSLMSTMAEGAAWGVGMSVARHVVGSMFGVSLPSSEESDDDTHSV